MFLFQSILIDIFSDSSQAACVVWRKEWEMAKGEVNITRGVNPFKTATAVLQSPIIILICTK